MPLHREFSCGEVMDYSLLNREEAGPARPLRVYLLKANKEGKITYYKVAGRFLQDGQTWEVERRYSEFLELRNKLIKFLKMAPSKCPRCENYLHSLTLFDFPKKHLFGNNTTLVVNYRCKALRAFLNLLAAWTFSNAPKCPSCGGYAFDAVRNFMVDGGKPHEGSSMETICSAFVVESFLSRSASCGFSGQGLPRRRPSFIAAADSEALRNSQSASPAASSSKLQSGDEDPYAEFNDFLAKRPTGQTKVGYTREVDINKPIARRNVEEAERVNNSSFLSESNSTHANEGGYVESFRFYNDEDRAAAASKGRSSSAQQQSGGNVKQQQPSKHHAQKSYSDRQGNEALYGSFTSFNSEERGHDPAFEPIVVSITKRSEDGDRESETDDEIDVQGLSIAASPRHAKKQRPSGEGLWQPWELAQAA